MSGTGINMSVSKRDFLDNELVWTDEERYDEMTYICEVLEEHGLVDCDERIIVDPSKILYEAIDNWIESLTESLGLDDKSIYITRRIILEERDVEKIIRKMNEIGIVLSREDKYLLELIKEFERNMVVGLWKPLTRWFNEYFEKIGVIDKISVRDVVLNCDYYSEFCDTVLVEFEINEEIHSWELSFELVRRDGKVIIKIYGFEKYETYYPDEVDDFYELSREDIEKMVRDLSKYVYDYESRCFVKRGGSQ